MSEFTNNVLNPPREIEVGQIWWSEEIQEELVITDDKLKSKDVFRAALVSRVIELDNGVDLLISIDKYPVYHMDRRIISKTDGPVHRSQLTFFRGKLTPEDIGTMKASLKSKPKNEYTFVQRNILSDMLEKLHPLRLKAFGLYEDSIPESSSPKLFLIDKLDQQTTPFSYSLAAADENVSEKIDEFWTAEWENRDNSIEVYSENEISIRFSVVNGHLYFVIYSGNRDSELKISNIRLASDKINIKSKEDSLEVSSNDRAFTGFEEQSIQAGNYKVYFSINDKKVSTNILIE